MESVQWRVQSGTDVAHWPHLSASSAAPAAPATEGRSHHTNSDITRGSYNAGSAPGAVADASSSTSAPPTESTPSSPSFEAYAAQWLDEVSDAPSTADAADAAAVPPSAEEMQEGEAREVRTTTVSAVAMLNALLVSLPPSTGAATAVPPTRCDGATLLMEAPVPILTAHDAAHGSAQAMAANLLRQSKWLAAGVAHGAGTVPRLPSALLLTRAFQHTFTFPVPAATPRDVSDEAAVGGSTPSSSSPLLQLLPSSSSSSFSASSHAPVPFHGCLVVLLFHPMRELRVWARDRLLRQLSGPTTSVDAPAVTRTAVEVAERQLAMLLGFALRFLCTLKHTSLLFELFTFAETRTPSTDVAAAGAVVVVAQERVHAVMEGVFHVLTLLAAWEARCGSAVDAWTAASTAAAAAGGGAPTGPPPATRRASAAPPPSPPLLSLLARCRATVVLLGGSLALYGVQALHRNVQRAVMEAWASHHHHQRHHHHQGVASSSAMDVTRAARVALTQLLHPLNALLAVNPRMPKPVAVPALLIKKTLVKVLVHCLLDNATGLPTSREHETWRRTRMQWLWGVAGLLEAPTARVAAPLSTARSDGHSAEDATTAVCAPEKTAGWLLKPLLKNAEQQFQWASAMATAKAKPTSVALDDATIVLDKAVYGLHLLLDSLIAALPSLLSTQYFHDLLASYEAQLLTLAIGGIVHTRTSHALRLHRLLFTADVRAFAAGAAAQALSPSSPTEGTAQVSNGGGGGPVSARPSPFVALPTVCLQRVWLTLPTLVTQVCRTALPSSSSSSSGGGGGGGSPASTPLPLPHVLAYLCGTLVELVAADAAPCAQWLLLSPTAAMATAPAPFQFVVQRCLKLMTEALREHHDSVQRAWLGLSAGAPLSTSTRAAAAAAMASHMLTAEKDLLRLIHALPFAAAEDGSLRKLGELLASVFCAGVTPAVTSAMAGEAAEWVWRRVVLPQPSLGLSPTTPSSWDVSSPSVANAARGQGRHWLTLLAACSWSQQDDWTVRCGWWMTALLADVVALDAAQRQVLVEGVLLELPTSPMLRASTAGPLPSTSSGVPNNTGNSNNMLTEEAEDASSLDTVRSPEYTRQAAQEKDEANRLYVVVQRLFLSVLRKAELFPRASLERLLLHISHAISPTRAMKDAAFQRAAAPLLMRLCPRRPDVQASLSTNAPPWLQQWTATAVQSLTACLAEQERRFRQFELEEATMKQQEDDAARATAMEAQLRRSNQARRIAEMEEGRWSSAKSTTSTTPTSVSGLATPRGCLGGDGDNGDGGGEVRRAGGAALGVSLAAVKEEGAVKREDGTAAPASRVLRQQLLFPDQPLGPAHSHQQQQQQQVNNSGGGGVKRERSPSPPACVDCDTPDEGSDVPQTAAEVIDLDVDSDDEEAVADMSVLDRLLPARGPTMAATTPAPMPPRAPAPTKAPQPANAVAGTGTVPPPPTHLQLKMQAIHARNTHRVHHAEQLRRLQDRLGRVAASTNLLHLQPPLINDIIGAGSQCMAPAVPVLPEVFVATAAVLSSEEAARGTAVAMPFGDAASVYAVRFAPHIALELRCDIIRNYEDLMEGVSKTQSHPNNGGGGGGGPPVQRTPLPPAPAPLSWTQRLPLHPSIPATCFAVHNVGVAQPTSNSSSNTHDPHRFRFAIRASANGYVGGAESMTGSLAGQGTHRHPRQQQQGQQEPRVVDPAVRAVANGGLSAGLSEGDVVVVLLPLYAVAEAWVERRLNVALSSLSAEDQAARVEEALSELPRSWRTLGCVTQVCHVVSMPPGERTAQLSAYPPTEPPSTGSSSSSSTAISAQPLRFLHALRMAYHTPQNTFFVRKLTSLNSFQMELAALHKIDHTRFAATLYDPRHAAAFNAVYYNWITGLLSASGPAQQPLLPQLRRLMLLQKQLNDWQIRAIVAVLYAICPDWDEGLAKRGVGAHAPQAPEVLLIEGPPGTGKTQTIGSLTLNVLHHLSRTQGCNARVLVCAPSNCAVDEALLRVVHLREQLVRTTGTGSGTGTTDAEPRPAHDVLSGAILRIGMKDRVDADVLRLADPVFLDDVVEQRMAGVDRHGSTGRGRGNVATVTSARNAVRAGIIDGASIIFSTLGSLHHISRQVQGLSFDVVIVDEASQGTEPAVLQALVLARKKCVLVGDSKQLQPTILSQEASRCGLRRSLLVRLLACGHQSFLLRTQYRMHPDICAFPNAYFYGGKLETDRSVRLRSATGSRTSGLLSDTVVHGASELTVAQRLGSCPRFVFVDVPQATMERRRGRSLFNRAEAAAVVLYMRQLRTLLRLSVAEMAPQVGIITFYNAQKDVILSLLTHDERRSGLQVASVDSFQGKEKRIILLSCVRTVRRSQLLAQISRSTPCAEPAEEHNGGAAGRKRGRGDSPVHDVDAPTFEERVESRRVGRFGLGFLADAHRLNVALTRAQDLCICVGSRDSLMAVGEAVLSARPRDRSSNSSNNHNNNGVGGSQALTTTDSTPDDVVRQLDADDEDPLALYRMLQHAESHDARLRPPEESPVELEGLTDSVEVVEGPSSSSLAGATAACVRYTPQSQLMKELTECARLTEERNGRAE